MKNRKLSNLGSAISDGLATSTLTIPVDQALYLQSYGKMGKTSYTTLRLAVLPYGLVFPPYDETAKHKHQNIVPTQLVIFNTPFLPSHTKLFRRSIRTRMEMLMALAFPIEKA